jgi:aryl-alcohol dehydrogenase-like predicted oxidoreductase
MRYLDTSGERLSIIGLGTWQFGSREWGYGSTYAESRAPDIARRAIELGINVIDTAEIYGFGRSEHILGDAIAGSRDQVFLATKIAPVLPIPAVISWRAESSARRLGVNEIDLYQLHSPNPAVPLSLQMAGMRAVRNRGLVRHIGVSNYSLALWQAAERALGGPVLSNQVSFSLINRRPLDGMVQWAAENGRVVIAYSPVAQGLLSGNYDAGHRPGGMRANQAAFLPESLERLAPLMDVLRQVGAAHDATPTQVALAWVVHHPNVIAIPGASSVEQLEENAAAGDLVLDDDEMSRLTAAAEAYEPIARLTAIPTLLKRRVSRH